MQEPIGPVPYRSNAVDQAVDVGGSHQWDLVRTEEVGRILGHQAPAEVEDGRQDRMRFCRDQPRSILGRSGTPIGSCYCIKSETAEKGLPHCSIFGPPGLLDLNTDRNCGSTGVPLGPLATIPLPYKTDEQAKR